MLKKRAQKRSEMLEKTAQKASEKGDFFMKIEKTSEGIKVTDISNLSLPETLDCGQCFRWKPDEIGNWRGVVKGVYGKIRQEKDGITFIGADEAEFNEVWLDYFDFNRDYDVLKSDFGANEMLKNACEFAPGIRVLRQEPWEAFITFIISQNNNIARIKGIVDKEPFMHLEANETYKKLRRAVEEGKKSNREFLLFRLRKGLQKNRPKVILNLAAVTVRNIFPPQQKRFMKVRLIWNRLCPLRLMKRANAF